MVVLTMSREHKYPGALQYCMHGMDIPRFRKHDDSTREKWGNSLLQGNRGKFIEHTGLLFTYKPPGRKKNIVEGGK